MKFFFIVTTSLINDNFEIRKNEYMNAINKLILELNKYSEIDKEIIIVENNGKRNTFLNEEFENLNNIKIIYTNNNNFDVNKGIKELLDIKYIFDNVKINDDDFIIKLTGRYIIKENSYFIKKIFNKYTLYDCFIKTGSIMSRNEKDIQDNFDCYTGLFAIKYEFIKNEINQYLSNYKNHEWIEWIIIAIIHKNIQNNKIKFLKKLDLYLKTVDMKNYELI